MTMPQTTFYAAKGGQGCSTIAAAAAIESAHNGPTVLVAHDFADACAIFGLPAHHDADAIEVHPLLTIAPAVPEGYDPSTETLIVDAGTAAVEHYGVRYLVTRPCYLALRRAAIGADTRPDGVVVIEEPGRALTAQDAADVVCAPLRATIGLDPAVARAVDAGLFASRLPRTLTRSLRHLIHPEEANCSTCGTAEDEHEAAVSDGPERHTFA